MGIRYTLELSEEQAEIIKIALEEYFRLRMNQTWDFADSLCFEDLAKNHTEEEFNKCIENRDMFRDELEKLLNMVHPIRLRGGKFREQTVEMRRAQDIWQVIRHRIWKDRNGDKNDWCVDAREPMPMTDEPLPKMEEIKMSIGKNIQRIRKEKGLSQKELGQKLGVSQQMIAQYENSNSKPKIETLQKIADVLEAQISVLDDRFEHSTNHEKISHIFGDTDSVEVEAVKALLARIQEDYEKGLFEQNSGQYLTFYKSMKERLESEAEE